MTPYEAMKIAEIESHRKYMENPEKYNRQYAAFKIGVVALFALVSIVLPLVRIIKTLALLP